MASLQAQVDGVKAAVASPSTCTPTTVVTLKKLLLPEAGESSSTTTTKQSTARATKATAKTTKTKHDATAASKEGLSPKDRTALATHVINATIKSLTEATKPAPPATPSRRSVEAPADQQSASRPRTLRRSVSAPLSPLQPRTLNRVATSPNIAAKAAKSAMASQVARMGATVECSRLAFACLRSVKGPIKADQTDFQIESGMSLLITKLVALSFSEFAIKELRILKRRLEGRATSDSASSKTESQTVSDLLDFQKIASPNSLSIVVACQIQALKLISSAKKPAHIEGVVPFLRESNPLSPLNILPKIAQGGESHASKAARQMATLCQTLLSMAPSVSSSEDEVALEPRLSAAPIVALELQILAFKTQLRWWKIAGHKGKVEEELLSPYSRCLKCFVRRQPAIDASAYQMLSTSYDDIMSLIRSQKYEPETKIGSPMASVYQSLGAAAQGARQYEVAFQWFSILRDLVRPDHESSVCVSSASARLLSVALKRSRLTVDDERLIQEVIAGLNSPLSGTSQEVNELLDSLSQARRSVAGLLMKAWNDSNLVTSAMARLLQDFIVKFPRFVARWLGAPPGKGSSAKQLLQFDSRRTIVMQSINQVLDATLMVVKRQIQSGSDVWDSVNEILHDCRLLLNNARDPTVSSSQLPAYYTKISTLYFSIFSQHRRKAGQSKADKKRAYQALNASIDTIKDCSLADKEQAQFTTKLELLADFCKAAGRNEDAIKSLRSICTHLIEDGVLAQVTTAMAAHSPRVAWGMAEKASTLSRALRSIASLDDSWNDWTFFLPEAERATVLEHLVHISTEVASQNKPLRLHDPGMAALLRILTAERFPIRRLRVLFLLLAQQLGRHDSTDDVAALIDQGFKHLQKDLAEDAGLASFVPHFRNYNTSLTALGSADDKFPSSALKDCIQVWSRMMQSCETQDQVKAIIDDPEGLLDHLLAANHLAGLRGETGLQVSILELCIIIAKACRSSNEDDLILYHCYLASQYVSTGLFNKASATLNEAKQLIKERQDAAPRVMIDYYLSQAEYSAGINQTQQAMVCLNKANDIHSAPSSSWSTFKAQATLLRSQAALAQSVVALQKGDLQEALKWGRQSVKTLSSEWNYLDGPSMSASPQPEPSLAESVLGKASAKPPSPAVFGTRLWVLAAPLMKSLLQISSVYSHIGMFQETIYFAETALRVAEATRSSMYEAEIKSWIASQYARAGNLEKALPYLQGTIDCVPNDASATRARLARQLGIAFQQMGEEEQSLEYMKMAEETVHSLARLGETPTEDTNTSTAAVTKGRGGVTATKRPAAAKTTRTRAATTTTRTTKRAPASKSKAAPAQDMAPRVPTDVYQASLLASIILARAVGSLQQQDWASVSAALESVRELPKLSESSFMEQLILASQHIGMSMEKMIQDPVFSVMQDSTISFPAVVQGAADKALGDKCQSPPRKGRAALTSSRASKEVGTPAFAEALKQAQEVLLDAQEVAFSCGDNGMLHRISSLLQGTVISLTAASSPKIKAMIRSDLTTVAVELARNAAWKREQLTLQVAPSVADATRTLEREDSPSLATKMENLSLTADMASFQNEFIEMVPENWSVISMSLSEDQHDLCITKFQAGHSPFILRLPLERANSRDADSEIFNFFHGRQELLEIIKMANETSHSSRDLTTKAARNAWWAEREALDGRLKELLMAVETTWLGGFKGIFSQHKRQSDLLARFQKTFQQILGKTLPSRTKPRGKRTTAKAPPAITLDPRILDLFVGLGDPSEPDCDFDEALNDLLYFVIDILQFHGERNAYDEIDFDAMVVDMYDALRGYYQATEGDGRREEDAHTVLVLDKALHAFPWESLPCMDGLAVSRVPSLACLQRLLKEAKMPKGTVQQSKGHYVSTENGTYMLNPSSDLKNTQSYFQKSFSELSSWRSIVNRAPREEEFESALSTSDVLLYFGHGGGAQYIRGKTIRRLEKCRPATFLMGCSSAALTDAGEFECYGPVWNYLVAGCPAVVGTLWDVTDRDIDRFAGRAFEEWGLFSKGTFKEADKGKGVAKGPAKTDEETGGLVSGVSLSEAVARARDACRMRYLNAAAVVMYGIPVYIEREVVEGV
ncbi:unnamed protein product [Clonostachys byssicola]|uniref:separase n=1 Tax=Clonostachys byssicola TaxID=160290 RepID=A0A9N9Y2S2_9HYPO|nr:unnamed protein product [Clonostachys byssicola]